MFFGTPQTDEEKKERIEALYARSRRQFPTVEGIGVEALQRRLDDGGGLVLLDVRKPAEQAVSMIPGAIPVSQLEANPERFRDREIVTYCTIGHRSGLYARSLQEAGFRVRNLEGSILSWTHTGRPLVDGQAETRRVHVGGPKWSLEASGYEPVW